MEFITQGINGFTVSKLVTKGQVINTTDDALDLMANAGSNRIVIAKDNICPDFFNLSTRLAGEILQKFSNYGVLLAIIGPFSNVSSKSLRDFIYESNKAGRILFLETESEIEKYWK